MSAARCLLAVPDRRIILFVELLPTFVSHPAPCPGAGFFFGGVGALGRSEVKAKRRWDDGGSRFRRPAK
jgi:hypothetical protein